MKKSYSFLMAAALVAGSLASCTVNDDIQTKSSNLQEIKFATGVQTRGTAFNGDGSGSDVDNPRLTDFQIYAFNAGTSTSYINGGVYTWESTEYKPDNTYYWPASGNLDFLAIAPSNVLAAAPTDAKTFTYTVADDISAQKDLMSATLLNQAKPDPIAALNLTFNHLLSKISLKAKVSTNLTVTIYGVSICNVKPQISFADADPAVTVGGSAKTYTVDLSESPVTLPTDGSAADLTGSNVLLLVPQTLTAWDKTAAATASTGSYLKVSLKVQNGSTYALGSAEAPVDIYYALGTTWTAGKHYAYTLNFGDPNSTTSDDGFGSDVDGNDEELSNVAAITFTASVVGWDDVDTTIDF